MRLDQAILRAAPIFNAPVVALTRLPLLNRLVGRAIAMVSYTGRRSGRVVSLPVGYRRRGGEVIIGVSMPDAKSWWRNFLGDGAPLTITLDGQEQTGHAIATRDPNGGVTVRVQLTR